MCTAKATIFVLLLGLLLPAAAIAESDAEAAARLRQEIADLIGEAQCRNLVNCRVVGLGARPCGGPEEYVAYSIWETRDGDAIGILVSEYNFLREDMMLGSDIVGTCEQLPKPGVNCINSRCVTVPAHN
jgi:hypothetical protein